MKNKVFTIPNLISFSRLPFAFLIILYVDSPLKYLFLGLSVIADFLDGYVARKLNQVSKLGAILDPLFDKLFALIIFVYFFVTLELPLFFILLFFLRDIITSLAALFFLMFKRKSKVKLEARLFGKIVTILQFLVLLFMVMKDLALIEIGIYVLFAMSLATLIDYFIYIKREKV
jgi:CDP-diacylglycerol--glycerol-3-phosphate 3-phosphatidyltransferase